MAGVCDEGGEFKRGENAISPASENGEGNSVVLDLGLGVFEKAKSIELSSGGRVGGDSIDFGNERDVGLDIPGRQD